MKKQSSTITGIKQKKTLLMQKQTFDGATRAKAPQIVHRINNGDYWRIPSNPLPSTKCLVPFVVIVRH